MPDEIDAIIARMSEAQKDAVVNAEDMHSSHGGYAFMAVKFCGRWNDPIAEFLTLRMDRLSPLGLAVRARLKENTDDR